MATEERERIRREDDENNFIEDIKRVVSLKNYLLLVQGNSSRDYRYCETGQEVKSIIESENIKNYDVFRRVDGKNDTWQIILIVMDGQACSGFDLGLIPVPLRDLI